MRARGYFQGRVLRERQRLRLQADGIQILEPSFPSEVGCSEVLPEPSYPKFAQSSDERFRWDLCARLVGVDKVPPIDPNSMWQEAIAFYGSSVDSEELWRLWNRVIAAKARAHG